MPCLWPRQNKAQASCRTIAVIDPDPCRPDYLDDILWPRYRTSGFAEVEAAVGRLRAPPAAVVLGEDVGPWKGVPAATALHREPALRDVPIILLGGDAVRAGGDVDAVVHLPVQDAELIDLLTRLGSHTVEAGWERLPAAPREALKRGLALFKGLADLIGLGHRLDFRSVSDACAPVLDAVKQAGHRHVFEGLRDHHHTEFVHSMRVSTLLALFGHAIGLDDHSLMTLASAGMLHDIGKTMLPPGILDKPAVLTPTEMVTARSHVERTVDYLESQPDVPRAVIAVAGQHHERLDGSGYPRGMRGDEINDLSRMAAIVDVFCALTERRPHRAAMGPFQALEVMQETIREKLDQRLVRVFSGMLVKAAA